ncbi:MAG: hypothetical protein KatS3mg061_0551 [Dehalococcoidia bacterium]|nr:MAG: hypothetical protein KatS3mg061_0551 [Dehalococcoidia bacterium]
MVLPRKGRANHGQSARGWRGRDRPALAGLLTLLLVLTVGRPGIPQVEAREGLAAVYRAAASAAAIGTRFQRAYAIPGIQGLTALAAAPTADGGFLLAGIAGNPYSTSDFWVMKTDAAGNVQWSRTYNVLQKDGGGLPPEGGRALDLVPTPDGGFLLAGSTCCYGGKAVAEVLKINVSGDVLWNKTYRSPSVSISIRRAVATSDGDFLLIGHSGPDATSHNMFAAKIGPDGTLRWSRIYDVIGNALDLVRDAAPTPDGGALLVGQLFQAGAALAFTIDGNGNVGWARGYGQGFYINWEANTVVRLPGGDFVLAGFAEDTQGLGRGGPWVMRTDSSGNVSWAKWGPPFYAGARRIVPLSDGNLLLAGTAWVTDFRDMAAAKMTPAGEVLWKRRYGRAYDDGADTAAAVPDGDFLLAGWSNDPAVNLKQDLYTVRADATGSSGCLEQDLPTGVTPIDLNTLVIGTPTVQATDIALVVETLAPSVGVPATQSSILCTGAMAWRLYLPLVLR